MPNSAGWLSAVGFFDKHRSSLSHAHDMVSGYVVGMMPGRFRLSYRSGYERPIFRWPARSPGPRWYLLEMLRA
jgi:hypothetical protein